MSERVESGGRKRRSHFAGPCEGHVEGCDIKNTSIFLLRKRDGDKGREALSLILIIFSNSIKETYIKRESI